MVVIGTDSHKRTHTVVALDGVGRKLGEKTVATTSDGHLALVQWASRWEEVTFALEDCRHLTRTLEGDLLRAGEHVLRVPTRLMAGQRRSARQPGKSDPIDALAVARAAWREPGLPTARLDGPAREVRLLVDHRDDLVVERTRVQSRIRWHLHDISPELHIPRADCAASESSRWSPRTSPPAPVSSRRSRGRSWSAFANSTPASKPSRRPSPGS
jgi:transposase